MNHKNPIEEFIQKDIQRRQLKEKLQIQSQKDTIEVEELAQLTKRCKELKSIMGIVEDQAAYRNAERGLSEINC